MGGKNIGIIATKNTTLVFCFCRDDYQNAGELPCIPEARGFRVGREEFRVLWEKKKKKI